MVVVLEIIIGLTYNNDFGPGSVPSMVYRANTPWEEQSSSAIKSVSLRHLVLNIDIVAFPPVNAPPSGPFWHSSL